MAIHEILLSLVKIFLIIIPGYVFAKRNVLSEEQTKGISSVVLNFTWPCLVVDSLQMAFSRELLINSAYIAAAITVILVIAYVLSFFVVKLIKIEKNKSYLFIFMLLFANTGFMGIPICQALYGSEGVFYAALMDSLGDIFVFTVGMALIRNSTGRPASMRAKELLTPGLFAIIVGILLFVTDTQLPGVISEPIKIAGSATTPLSMLIVGFQLGKMSLRDLAGDRHVNWLMALKLIVVPAMVLGVLKVIFGEFSIFAAVIVMEAAMPVATCTVIFAEQYGGDTAFTAKGVLATTLASILTIPIFAVIVGI